jgi:hypothetical protein
MADPDIATFSAETTAIQSQRQWLRKISLVAGDSSGKALDFSELQVRFTVSSATTQTFRQLNARIYNVSKATALTVEKEFTQVQLSAGYQDGPFGIIFSGQIAQIRRGHENSVDSFLDIIGADGDQAGNWSILNTTMAAGWTMADFQKILLQALQQTTPSITMGYSPELSTAKAPRGRTLYGSTRDFLREFANNTGTQWNLADGKLNFVPKLSYIPGDAIALNAASGMIGFPVQTIDGIVVRALLNPNIRTGRLLQIDNASIQTTTLKTPTGSTDSFFIPSTDADGSYKVYALKHIGDTRGQEWYTDAICAAQNGTLPATGTFINAVADDE